MEKVIRFTSKDGTEWKTRSEAMERDCALNFGEWYDDGNEIDDGDGHTMDSGGVFEWLCENYKQTHETMKQIAAINRRKNLDVPPVKKAPVKKAAAKKDAS
jgi:hypothetical protein